jgi:hypothetical protein
MQYNQTVPMTSILPNWQNFANPPPEQVSPLLVAISPAAAALHAVRGLGTDPLPDPSLPPPPPPAGTTAAQQWADQNKGAALAIGYGLLVLFGWLSYQAGSAMAPSAASKSTWGWVGVPVGILTGPIGLGIMGIVSNRKK